MSKDRESFGDGVLACVEDISRKLPDLNRRYPALVILRALGEHAGSALSLLIQNQVCDPAQARQLIERIRNTAFPSGAGPDERGR